MKSKQKILGIQSLLSKILDSLCLELTLTINDKNCISLIEILQWRLTNEITPQEFSQLYKDWIEAKNIKNIFQTKQKQCFDKLQLINSQRINKQILTISNITQALEYINQQYNNQFILQKEGYSKLDALENIFNYLDSEGCIHLRISQIIFIYFGLIHIKKMTGYNVENFRKKINEFIRQINCVDGKWSLRNFKNYLNQLCSTQNINQIIKFLKNFETTVNSIQTPPNLFEQAFEIWSNHQRFQFDNRKLNIYKRIFEQHQNQFFNFEPKSDKVCKSIYTSLENTYTKQILMTYNLGLDVVKEFYQTVQKLIDKYIKLFFIFQHPKNQKFLETNKSQTLNSLQKKSKQFQSPSASFYSPQNTSSAKKQNKSVDHSLVISRFEYSKIENEKPKSLNKQKMTRKDKFEILHSLKEFKHVNIERFEDVMKRLKLV